jgi:hypothetical protein
VKFILVKSELTVVNFVVRTPRQSTCSFPSGVQSGGEIRQQPDDRDRRQRTDDGGECHGRLRNYQVQPRQQRRECQHERERAHAQHDFADRLDRLRSDRIPQGVSVEVHVHSDPRERDRL